MFVRLTALLEASRRAREGEARGIRRAIARPSGNASAEERRLAARLRALRGELARAIASPTACRGCAAGRAAPVGTFDGGHCCSGATSDVWTPLELAAHAIDGTRARDIRGARGAPGGCAFRGPRGCSLTAADRPSVCARYVCSALARELHAGGRLDATEVLLAELDDTVRAFAAAHAARTADEEWAAIVG